MVYSKCKLVTLFVTLTNFESWGEGVKEVGIPKKRRV